MIYLMMIDSVEEQSKFEKLYNTYKGLMYYIAFGILNNSEDAEDVVHNAFMKIAENISKIDEVISPKTQMYVVTIAENKAIDLYRNNYRRRRQMEYFECISERFVSQMQEGSLGECIAKLPIKYREVILLKYYMGFSCKEIAKQLDISVANAIKLDQRAKKKLHLICEEEGII